MVEFHISKKYDSKIVLPPRFAIFDFRELTPSLTTKIESLKNHSHLSNSTSFWMRLILKNIISRETKLFFVTNSQNNLNCREKPSYPRLCPILSNQRHELTKNIRPTKQASTWCKSHCNQYLTATVDAN